MRVAGKRLKAPETYRKRSPPSVSKSKPRRHRFGMPVLLPFRSIRPLAVILVLFMALYSLYNAFHNLKSLQKFHRIALTIPTRSPTRYRGSVPIVDRDKYAEVEARMEYHANLEGGNPNYQEWILPPNPLSPPKITAIPEPLRNSKHHALEFWSNEKADFQLCRETSGCRLLLPTW